MWKSAKTKKNIFVTTALLMMFAVGPSCAQKWLTVPQELLPVIAAEKSGFAVGNVKIRLPAHIMRQHSYDLYERYTAASLSDIAYPRYALKNDIKIARGLMSFVKDYERFEKNLHKIVDNLSSDVYVGKVPYEKFLPREVDVLYIGEVHQEELVQKEIADLVTRLPSIYPDRTIYLAAEFIPAKTNVLFHETQFIRNKADLEKNIEGLEGASSVVLKAAVEKGIPLLGLENFQELGRACVPKGKTEASNEEILDFSASLEGVSLRNRYWAAKLRALRRYDPKALVVVYAGMGHVGYHNEGALPHRIMGRSFVVQVTVPYSLTIHNPLFAYLKETEDVVQLFRSSRSAKLVNAWKKLTPFKNILGADLSVIVHE